MVSIEPADLGIVNLKFLLLCFENMSGLKFNFDMSEVMVIGVKAQRSCAYDDNVGGCGDPLEGVVVVTPYARALGENSTTLSVVILLGSSSWSSVTFKSCLVVIGRQARILS
jgi:hypothetical protein